MNRTGCIDWTAVTKEFTPNLTLHTFIYAYWLADTVDTVPADVGISIIKPLGSHPDWFIQAANADTHLSANTHADVIQVSQTYFDVFGDHTNASHHPLLASVLLGTADYAFDGWACERNHLTRSGQNLLRKLDSLYLRPATIVTFQQTPSDESERPRDGRDTATV